MSLESEKLLDDIGSAILRELQENARVSFVELGRRVGLTSPAVIERVRRMEDCGIITGYRAEVDPSKIGQPITAFVRLSVGTDVLARINSLMKDWPEIVECHRVTGGDSFIMKIVVSSVEHLESLIDRLTPFGTTSTSVVLSSPVKKKELRPAVEYRPRNQKH